MMQAAKIHSTYGEDRKDATPREKAVAYRQMTWKLTFKDPEDETKYLKSLKNLFFFPTFSPIIIVFLAFTFSQRAIVLEVQEGDIFLAFSFAVNLANVLVIFVYTSCQMVDFFRFTDKNLVAWSKFILSTRLEDMIIILSSIAQGIYQLSIVSRDLCTGCGTLFEVVDCNEHNERAYPIQQTFFAYVSLVVLPIYFKSINRHIVLLSWGILTIFVIAVFFYGGYQRDGTIVLFIIFFLVSICEFERYKMISFLLSKEALSYEQNKLFLMSEKSKIIERKLNLALVHQILPPKVAEQIIAGKTVVPETFPEVTIFFSDVVGFTTICSAVDPPRVVRMLNDLYTAMDYVTSLFPLYKVETIGDAYMLVGGLPSRDKDHALHIANFALLVQRAVQSVKSPVDGSPINIRIGLHSGPVMAGVVGNLMPRYCLFGDTVNTASRMESNGIANRIHCSETTAKLLMNSGLFELSCRGEIDVKGKGRMTTYWLERAVEKNDKANAIAIERTENMVEELLESALQDSQAYVRDEIQEIDTTGVDDIPLIDDEPGDLASPTAGCSTGGSTQRRNSSHRGTRSNSSSNSSITSQSMHGKSRPSIRFGSSLDRNGVVDSSGAKILVVEDVELQRKLMVRKLKSADASWDIVTAVSGEDALQKLKVGWPERGTRERDCLLYSSPARFGDANAKQQLVCRLPSSISMWCLWTKTCPIRMGCTATSWCK